MSFTKGQMNFSLPSGPPRVHPPTAALTRILAQNGVLRNGELDAAAGQYFQLANQWSNLAKNALPSKIPVFDHLKKMLNNQYQAYRLIDFDAYDTISEDLNILAKSIETDFPLDAHETSQRFERLSGQVKLIAELEMSAARQLRDITRE